MYYLPRQQLSSRDPDWPKFGMYVGFLRLWHRQNSTRLERKGCCGKPSGVKKSVPGTERGILENILSTKQLPRLTPFAGGGG